MEGSGLKHATVNPCRVSSSPVSLRQQHAASTPLPALQNQHRVDDEGDVGDNEVEKNNPTQTDTRCLERFKSLTLTQYSSCLLPKTEFTPGGCHADRRSRKKNTHTLTAAMTPCGHTQYCRTTTSACDLLIK